MKITEITKTNSEAKVDVIFTQKEIDNYKESVLDSLISKVTVKGFRQGKAPKKIATSQINPDELSDGVFNKALSSALKKIMPEKQYRLLGRPVLDQIDTNKKDGGWVANITFPLYPEIKLGKYKTFFTSKPNKKTSAKTEVKKESEDKVNKVYETLLKKIKVDISSHVINEEVNHSLTRLESQAKTLNLTLKQYLKAINKSIDEIKASYQKSAEEAIKLDLILLEIAKEEKIDTPPEEIEKLAKASQIHPSQAPRLKNILDRQKTIEFLKSI